MRQATHAFYMPALLAGLPPAVLGQEAEPDDPHSGPYLALSDFCQDNTMSDQQPIAECEARSKDN